MTIVDSDGVINKSVLKILRFSILQVTFFSLKFFVGVAFVETALGGTDFVGIVFVTSIISSYITSESPMIFLNFLSISQADALGFQT